VRDLLARPSYEVAPMLLGWTLTSVTDEGTVVVQLTEVEAYDGENDSASHAWRGQTARNATMFGPAGFLYVYRSHGLHWCMNVVTGPEGAASAVLLRAGRVIEGEDIASARRGPAVTERGLARGPGCLGQALGVTGDDDGTDLTWDAGLYLQPRHESRPLANGPRVGVSRAADVPWRWWISGEPTVSAYRRSPRAPQGEGLESR
jgi:DNA-3-methyladenine glycosylase